MSAKQFNQRESLINDVFEMPREREMVLAMSRLVFLSGDVKAKEVLDHYIETQYMMRAFGNFAKHYEGRYNEIISEIGAKKAFNNGNSLFREAFYLLINFKNPKKAYALKDEITHIATEYHAKISTKISEYLKYKNS